MTSGWIDEDGWAKTGDWNWLNVAATGATTIGFNVDGDMLEEV